MQTEHWLQRPLDLTEPCVYAVLLCIRIYTYAAPAVARFVLAAVDHAIAMGAAVHTHTPVLSVTRTRRDQYCVKTAKGEVRCQKVIFACNAYSGALVPALGQVCAYGRS